MRAAVVLCLAASVGSLGLGASAGARPDGGGTAAAKVARAYVRAFSRRDGKTICASSASELRRWYEHLYRPALKCPRAAAAYIGYGEEGDTPRFQRLEVLRSQAHVSDTGMRVEVAARYHYKASPKPLTFVFTDELYLLSRHGRWQVVKPGAVYFLTRSAYNVPESFLDPPITDAEAHKAAPQPAASFTCSPAASPVVEDAAGDAAPSLDVREASASVNDDGSVCLGFAFVAPPHPGTDLELRLEQPEPDDPDTFDVTEVSVRIGSRGRLYLTLHLNPAATSRLFQAGWRDGRLEVLWLAQNGSLDGHHPFRLTGNTKTLQWFEPLVRHPMLGRGDAPTLGWADSFGPPE